MGFGQGPGVSIVRGAQIKSEWTEMAKWTPWVTFLQRVSARHVICRSVRGLYPRAPRTQRAANGGRGGTLRTPHAFLKSIESMGGSETITGANTSDWRRWKGIVHECLVGRIKATG